MQDYECYVCLRRGKNMLLTIIYSIIVVIVLGFLYKKLMDWEHPLKISRAQAIIPVGLGILSLPLSFAVFLFIGAICHNVFGFSIGEGPLLLASFTSALLAAAMNEELAKLIFILIVIFIFRKKIRNVYEYILIGGAVGFGFTIVEEYVYGSGISSMIVRVVTVTFHMLLGFAMGRHLGLARYNKVTGRGSAWKEYLLAYFVPVAVHTIYDTLAVNKLITAEDEVTQALGMVMVIVAIVLAFALQVYVFKRLKKNAGTLTALSVIQNDEEGVAQNGTERQG